MRDNDSDIREIKGRSRDIEDSDNSLSGSNSDKIETDTEDDDEPDRIDRCMGVLVHFAPKAD